VAISPDGKMLAVGAEGHGTIHVHNLALAVLADSAGACSGTASGTSSALTETEGGGAGSAWDAAAWSDGTDGGSIAASTSPITMEEAAEGLCSTLSGEDKVSRSQPRRADAEVLKDLRERLKAWQAKTHDPWLVKYRYE
jgi:hypothetical protein